MVWVWVWVWALVAVSVVVRGLPPLQVAEKLVLGLKAGHGALGLGALALMTQCVVGWAMVMCVRVLVCVTHTSSCIST